MALAPRAGRPAHQPLSTPTTLPSPVGPAQVLGVKLSQGASTLPTPEPTAPSSNAPSLRQETLVGKMRARGFWGPRGSDEEVWEQQQLQAPQNRARELDSQAEGQRGGGPPGGWHEQRQTEVGAEHPSAGTHRPPPQHPSPSEAPGSRLPRRWPAVLLSTQKPCVRCPVAGPCPGEEEDSETGCQGREGQAEGAGRRPREALGAGGRGSPGWAALC